MYNALAAAACALRAGIPFDKVVEVLCAVQGVKGRAEIVPTGRDFTVVIDYAHTPDRAGKHLQNHESLHHGAAVNGLRLRR